MSQSPLDDFLYHLKRYMEYTTEMRSSFEHLTEREKQMIIEASPSQQGPEELSKHAYEWHDALYSTLKK
ncbi:hypothetical protein LCM20_02520 [Halobacillus litoralis]|uniref:hypothetical protein n=1 Tax=Halobacillus litoralis TaxID=45668 RepID=UPI001CD34290|nr:hypothetical protein [Halobacillus litoralis]MCA0969464.1 hypothetical protein [Halobacillus litoralis]